MMRVRIFLKILKHDAMYKRDIYTVYIIATEIGCQDLHGVLQQRVRDAFYRRVK